MIRDFTAFARFRVALAIAAALVLAAPALAEDGPKEAPYTYRAEVVDVIDGDTIDVHIDLGFYVWIRFQRIHLYGIEAPEPSGATEAAGVAAKEALATLIKGKMVILKSLRGEDSPDRAGSFGNNAVTITGNGANGGQSSGGGTSKRYSASIGASWEPDLWGRIRAGVKQAGALAAAVEALARSGVEVRTAGPVGDAADEIVRLAKEMRADVIVLGARGLNPLKRLVLGSVSTRVLHHAPCDVLVVR